MSEKLILRSSKVNTFLHCRKRYYWEYVEFLTPKDTSVPLQVGTIVHKLLDLYHKGELTVAIIEDLPNRIHTLFPTNSEELTEEIASEAARLVKGYLAKWGKDDLQVISSEVMGEVEMPNYILRIRADGLARSSNKKLWRLEHKTTARMDSAYLNGLKAGIQGAMYDFVLDHLFKEEVAGTIYNLLVKTKVPQFERTFSIRDMAMRERMLKTLDGVARDILSGDFYPSCQCFLYGRPCPFKPLCDFESKEVREAFYIKRDYSPDDREEHEVA